MSNLYYTTDTHRSVKVNINVMTFPGGEVGVNVNTGDCVNQDVAFVNLYAHVTKSDDVMALLLATEALRHYFPLAEVVLVLPYIPYARQDRRCNAGEALSIKVFANLINSQNYKAVTVYDPHSQVSAGLIDRCHVVNQYELFSRTKLSWHGFTIVAPDLGAVKRCEEFAKKVGASGVLIANKKRELSTGKIIGMDLIGSVDEGAKLVVLDDLCDGGRTFVELAALLTPLKPECLELYVTHGIFSKGVEVLDMYDKIVTTNSFHNGLESTDKLTVIEVV